MSSISVNTSLENIGITARHVLSAEGKGEIIEIVKYLYAHNKKLFVTEKIYTVLQKIITDKKILESCTILTTENIEQLDLFIFFGGDGTLLSALHEFAPAVFSVPIFGINGGNLGFFFIGNKRKLERCITRNFCRGVYKR